METKSKSQVHPPRSPNSFHYDPEKGSLQPGLGPDEPPPEMYLTAAEAAAKYRQLEEALATAKADVRGEAEALERRAAQQDELEDERTRAFEDRMKALEDREEALKQREREQAGQ